MKNFAPKDFLFSQLNFLGHNSLHISSIYIHWPPVLGQSDIVSPRRPGDHWIIIGGPLPELLDPLSSHIFLSESRAFPRPSTSSCTPTPSSSPKEFLFHVPCFFQRPLVCSPLHTLHQTGGGKQRLGLAARQVVEHRLGLAAQMLHTEVERRQNGNDLTKTQTHTQTHKDTHRHTTTHIQKSGEKTEFATTYATRHGSMH